MLTMLEVSIVEDLQSRGLPPPEVGQDLVVGQETVGTAELSWPSLKVAVINSAEGSLQVPGWLLIPASTPDIATRIQEAIAERSGMAKA